MQSMGVGLNNEVQGQTSSLLQELYNAEGVPTVLMSAVRRFQEEAIGLGIDDRFNMQNSHIERCEILIGGITVDLCHSSQPGLPHSLPSSTPAGTSGHLDWHFSGTNCFGSITLRVRENTWEVEFARLRRPVNALRVEALVPQSHQRIYQGLEQALIPVGSTELGKMVILQGPSGLGKSYVGQYYFYHNGGRHQMLAWLSGQRQEAFLADWQALANQLRHLQTLESTVSDDEIIRRWCEEQLGHWLLVIDDVGVELDWLRSHLPRRGGHVLITTRKPVLLLPEETVVFPFAPLDESDARSLLKASLDDWEGVGYAEEAAAIVYFLEAMRGIPSLLSQIALLVKKKDLSFERLQEQFKEGKTRRLILSDTVYDQVQGQTLVEVVEKNRREGLELLPCYGAQGEIFLNHLVTNLQGLGKEAEWQVSIEEEGLIELWRGIEHSLSLEELALEKIKSCLGVLSFIYDEANRSWQVGQVMLEILGDRDKGTVEIAQEERPEVGEKSLHFPRGLNIEMRLDNSRMDYARIEVLSIGKPTEFATWKLPRRHPDFIPRPSLTEEIGQKLPLRERGEARGTLVLAAATGMGGIGKTTLACDYANREKNYTKRFWINASSVSQVQSEFRELGEYLGLIESGKYVEEKELIETIHRWLNIHSGWLMVFDNADDYTAIVHWLPKEGGSVLVTTREPKPGELEEERIIKVPLLEEEESISWLFQLVRRKREELKESEKEAAKQLVEALGYLPLAIAQAAAYLREHEEESIEGYCCRFRELLSL